MSDIAETALAMQTAQTQHTAQLMVLKQQHEMELDLIEMIDENVQSAPPPRPEGMGLRVDKSA